MEKGDLTDVKLEKHPTSPYLKSFNNRLKLLTYEEALSLMPVSEETQRLQKVLGQAYTEMRLNGAGLTSGFVLALGKKQK